jgi:hypothetical protein
VAKTTFIGETRIRRNEQSVKRQEGITTELNALLVAFTGVISAGKPCSGLAAPLRPERSGRPAWIPRTDQEIVDHLIAGVASHVIVPWIVREIHADIQKAPL